MRGWVRNSIARTMGFWKGLAYDRADLVMEVKVHGSKFLAIPGSTTVEK